MRAIILIGIAAMLSGCDAPQPAIDQRARYLIFIDCLEASAAIITANSESHSEAHETVVQCDNQAFQQAQYLKHPDEPRRPDITEEWLRAQKKTEEPQ